MNFLKKLFILFFCSTIVLFNLQKTIFAAEVTTIQNNIEYLINTETKTAKIISGNPTNEKIIVPDEILYDNIAYSVTCIGQSAFAMKNYTEIIIGSNVETIESMAFDFSFNEVSKIYFKNSKCQNISFDAFNEMSFASNFSIVVNGPDSSMNNILSNVNDLKPYVVKIIYLYTTASAVDIQNTENLQTLINNAEDNQATTIFIDKNIYLSKTITIPANKNIVISDDGNSREIWAINSGNVAEMFIVEKNASLTFEETNSGTLTFVGANINSGNGKGNIVKVKGSFYLKSGTLKLAENGYIKASLSAAVFLENGAYFAMSGGFITNFKFDQNTYVHNLTAPVIVTSNAEFVMSGGSIKNNSNQTPGTYATSGGVLLYTWYSKEKAAKMTLSGTAEIKSNLGGGINLVNETDFIMNGGTISDNKNLYGGGVCVSGNQGGHIKNPQTRFTMTNGTITRNFSYNSGGGIYVNSSQVSLEGGYITDNEALKHGGGIYVSTMPYTLQMYNVVITENLATAQGGGIWLCPTGVAQLHITNGSAIFDNLAFSANGNPAAGDDLAFVGGGEKTGGITLSNRMLGGGLVTYYKDGAVYNTDSFLQYLEQGAVDENVARFDLNNPGKALTTLAVGESCALKSISSDETKQLANSMGKLFITGNKATRGGGVGSNGGIVIGEYDEYTLTIVKVWDEKIPDFLLKPVTIYLKVGNTLLDCVQLNEDNNWSVQLSNLPNPDSLNNLEYSVIEFPVPEPFKAEYIPATINVNTKTITISVQNVFTPDKPVPNTGDNNIVYFTTMISSLSLLAIAMIIIKRKHFEKAWFK